MKAAENEARIADLMEALRASMAAPPRPALRMVHLLNSRGSKRTQLVETTTELRESYERTGETWKVVRVDPVAIDITHVPTNRHEARSERAGVE